MTRIESFGTFVSRFTMNPGIEELDIATLGKRSVHGVLALISRTFFLNLLSFVARITVYTVLVARDVGIYTAVIAIQRIISFFTDFGLGAALVQKKEALELDDLRTSFTIQASVTFTLFLLVFFLREQISDFFRLDQAGQRLLLVLVFTLFISSFKTIPSILLERHIHFGKLVIPQVIESVAFYTILIVLAVRNFGLDSYTFAFFVSSLVSIPIYYAVSPWNIGIGISTRSLNHLKFGAQFQAKNILAAAKDDLLTVFLVKFLNFTQIGYIGFAQGIAFFFYRYVVDSVTKVTFSTYSRIQESEKHLQKAIEKSLFFISLVMFPLLVGLIVTVPYFISYFPRWQHKWEPAIVSLVFFSLNALFSSLSGILVNVLDASGRVKTTLRLMVVWTVLTWTLTPLFIMFFGFHGVAIASFLVTLTIFYTVHLVKKIVPFSLLRNIYKPAIATAIMSFAVWALASVLVSDLVTLFFVILLGGLIYSLMILMLARAELVSDFRFVFKKHE